MTTTDEATIAPEIARILARHPDATWTHQPALPLTSIDLIASITNQVRDEAIDRPTVDRYVAALEDGATFPPIIVRDITTETARQLVNLGGNHRTRAHIDAARKTIDAYVVVCDDLTALEIAYADNATHGLPPTDAERLAHALVLIDRGRSLPEAAGIVGTPVQRLRHQIESRKVDKRAAGLGVASELQQVMTSLWVRLSSIKDDRLFVKVVRTIAAEKMGQLAAQGMLTDANIAPDLAAAMDAIALHVRDWRNRPGNRSSGARNPHTTLILNLRLSRSLDPADVLACTRNQREREELARLCLDGARHLKAIHDLAKVTP